MANLKILIDRIDDDGNAVVEEKEVNLSLDSLTLREAVLVEELLGGDKFDRLMEGDTKSPAVVQAVVYAKLKSEIPDLDFNGFDLDLSSLNETDEDESEGKSSVGE